MSNAEFQLRTNRPKTSRGVRLLKKRIGQVKEDQRKQIVLRAKKTSPVVLAALHDLHMLKGSDSKKLNRRIEDHVFDEFSHVSRLSERNDSTLFVFGSSTKKRKHNLVLGRLYDFQLVDMFEFGINAKTFQPMESFIGIDDPKSNDRNNKSFGFQSKPAILFQGGGFQNDLLLRKLKPFLLDYFRGVEMGKFNLMTLDHVMVFTAVNLDEVAPDKQTEIGFAEIGQLIMFRHYKVEFQSSQNAKLPFVHLREIGPAMDLHCRRHEFGNDELIAKAMAHPERELLSNKPKKKNNHERGRFGGERRGRVHIDIRDQKLDKMPGKRMKALRDRRQGVKWKPARKQVNNRNKRNNRRVKSQMHKY